MLYRKCVRINIKSAFFIIFSLILGHIRITHTSVSSNSPESTPVKTEKNISDNDRNAVTITNSNNKSATDTSHCPNDTSCNELPNSCLQCHYNMSCTYGAEVLVNCGLQSNVICNEIIANNTLLTPEDAADSDINSTTVKLVQDTRYYEIKRKMVCRYCYQTEKWEQDCEQKNTCNSIGEPIKTNCTVKPEILCLGNRVFSRKIPCNWTQGYRWSTTLIISITLGGFGVDRFFLGHWQEGIGKLFSFGGLGVWTLIDVLLISLHYLGPADGSLYL